MRRWRRESEAVARGESLIIGLFGEWNLATLSSLMQHRLPLAYSTPAGSPVRALAHADNPSPSGVAPSSL